MTKKWLLIAHGFNMDGRAASLTVTDKLPYFKKQGIELIVLSAVTGARDESLEHYQLLPWGPSGLRFDFRHWFANRYGRGFLYKLVTRTFSILLTPFIALEKLLFGLSNQSSWAIPAAIKGVRLVREHKIDVMYTSAGVWSALLAGYWIKRITGVKWIAEIHDPLVVRRDANDEGISKRKGRDAIFMQKLEGLVCQYADQVCWFTEGALRYAKLRHPELGDKGFVILPGAEPPGCDAPIEDNYQYGNVLRLCYFGTLANDRSLAPIIEALSLLINQHQIPRGQVQIEVYGTPLDAASMAMAKNQGLTDVVKHHGRFERAKVVELMRHSDVLIALHGSVEWTVECIPSKIYDYFWSDRPIFGVTDRNPQLDGLLAERNAYICHTHDLSSIKDQLKNLYDDWKSGSLSKQTYKPISPEQAVNTMITRIFSS